VSGARLVAATSLLALAASASGCTGDVEIGAIISQTGGVAAYGRQVKQGLDLAVREINAAGGFEGGTIELVYRDDESDPEVGARHARDLIQNHGIRIIIGAVSSPVTLAIAPICQQNEVLLLSPSSSAPKITSAGEFIFRNFPSDVLEGTAMADFAKGLGLHRVVVLAMGNAYGEGLRKVFADGFESRSREIVETLEIAEGGVDALPPLVEEVKRIAPAGIYIVAYENEMAALLELLHGAGVDALLMASSSVTDRLLAEAGAAAERLVFPRPSLDVASSDERVAAFVAAYRERYHTDPDIYAAHGYDALKLIWKAMLDAGVSRPEEVASGLLRIDNYQGAAGRTSFDEMGDVVRYPQLFVVHEGRPIPYERFEQDGGDLSLPGRT
jgi:branched-chain amino acid transport system substrate-binding protein